MALLTCDYLGVANRLALLQKLFKDKQWDVNELATRAQSRGKELRRETVSRHLNGKQSPSFSTWKAYASAFDMTIDEFDRTANELVENYRPKGAILTQEGIQYQGEMKDAERPAR